MKIHCIAIGEGIMCHLALALAQKGYTVTGSDTAIGVTSQGQLAKKGLLPNTLGWYPEKIHSALDAVVLGTRVKPSNPELLRAQALGVKLYSYPEFLYEQSQYKTRVVIAGRKGKTFITATILHVLHYHNITVDYSIETPILGLEGMVHVTEDNDFMVLEGDAYPTSCLNTMSKLHQYRPNIALLSDLAWEATEAFPTFETYVQHFQTFVDGIVKGGSITYNEEDPEVKKLVENSKNTIRKLPYRTPHYRIANEITLLDTPEGEMPLETFDAYLLRNLAGAQWICQHIGVDATDFYEAIASFTAPSKHIEKKAENTDSHRD